MTTTDFNPLKDGEYAESLGQDNNLQPFFNASWSYVPPLIIAILAIAIVLWLKLQKK